MAPVAVLPNPEERFLILEQEPGLWVVEDASFGPASSNSLRVLTQLLQCPDVAAAADDEVVRTLANWFQREEPAVVKLLLRAVGILSRHESTVSWPHPGSRTCRPRGPRGGWGGRLSQGQTEGVPTKPAH